MKKSLISKVISVGIAFQIGLFGGLSVCAGNSLSLHTQKKSTVKLEPVYLACVFINMPFYRDDKKDKWYKREEFKSLRTLPLISKNAAEAMKMIKIFDFRDFATLEKENDYYVRLVNLVAKIYPSIQTVNCTLYQMFIFDGEFNIFKNLIKDKIKTINITICSIGSIMMGCPHGFKEGKMNYSYDGIKVNTTLTRVKSVQAISPKGARLLIKQDIDDFNSDVNEDGLTESRILYVYSLGRDNEDQVLKILKEVTSNSNHKLFCFGVESDEFLDYCMNRVCCENDGKGMTSKMRNDCIKHGHQSLMQIIWKSSVEGSKKNKRLLIN